MSAQSAAPVLVVDDDADIRDTLRAVMEDARHPVAEAASATEALRYLRAAPSPHVVLLDFLLAGGNAGTLLRAVEHETTLKRHCYVLIPASPLTAFPQDDQRLIATTCVEVVLKPFDIDELLQAVDAAAAQLPVSWLRRLATRTSVLIRRRTQR
jgi:CheY-like chemotaxis protein